MSREARSCKESLIWRLKHWFASTVGGSATQVHTVGEFDVEGGAAAAGGGYGAIGDGVTEELVAQITAALGKSFTLTRPVVKTHKESKKTHGNNSKSGQLRAVVHHIFSILSKPGADLFGMGNPPSRFVEFVEQFNACNKGEALKRVCIQVDATHPDEEPAVYRPREGAEFKNGCLVFRVGLPWSDYEAYTTSASGVDPIAELLETARTCFLIENFLKDQSRDVRIFVGAAPLTRTGVTKVIDKKDRFHYHCKSGQGRGPFLALVVQLLRVIFRKPGVNPEGILQILQSHNRQAAKRVTSESYRCATRALAVLGGMGLLGVAIWEAYCSENTSGSVANVSALFECVQSQFSEVAASVSASLLVSSGAMELVRHLRLRCQPCHHQVSQQSTLTVGALRSHKGRKSSSSVSKMFDSRTKSKHSDGTALSEASSAVN